MRLERQENLFFGLLTINGKDKPGELMNLCIGVFLLSIVTGCSADNSAKTTSFPNSNATVHNRNSNIPDKQVPPSDESSKTLDCNDPNGYSLVVVEDPSRNIEDTITAPKILNIVVGNKIKTAIKIPTGSDANGFSLDSAEKTKEGFEIRIEYGTRYYYEKQFKFICKENNFYLYKVKTEMRDKNQPENWDEPNEKEVQIEPELPIERFSIFDYLGNQ